MRILIATGLYPPEIGGPATYTRALEAGLPRYGIEVTVAPFSKVRTLPKLVRHIWYFFLVFREGKRADLIYAQDPVSTGLPALLAARLLGKRFILKVVGDYAWEQASQRSGFSGTPEEFQYAKLPLLPRILRSVERSVAHRAERIIVPSKYLAKIVSQWGIERRRLSVIYNGMEDVGDTGNKPVLRGLVRFHGKLITSVGRLVPWKGFTELIRITKGLKNDFPDLKLMIVGSGPDLPALEAAAAAEGLADDVIFTGALSRDILLRYLRLSDVFVLNTRYEGFSHLLLEVMAVGVPVVTTKVGGNPEIVEDDKTGFLTAPDDRAKIASHIKALLSDASLRARLVAAAKRKVREFSDERMVRETAKLLSSL